MTLPFAVTGSNIGPTDYCMNSRVSAYATVATIAPFVFDTFVLVAISWRLTLNAYNVTMWGDLKTLLFGKSLPIFSRALLHDNQKYYLYARFLLCNCIRSNLSYNLIVPRSLLTLLQLPCCI